MSKKKNTISGPAGLLIEAFRFGFGWGERSVKNLFKILPKVGKFLKDWNTKIDRWTIVNGGSVIPVWVKILVVGGFSIFLWKFVAGIFLLYVILKSL
jgi:hypothetical protein